MTTSFAHFTRGEWTRAIRANAGGAFLAAVCAALVPWCTISMVRGRYFGISDPARGLLWTIVAVAGVSLVSWLFQLCG